MEAIYQSSRKHPLAHRAPLQCLVKKSRLRPVLNPEMEGRIEQQTNEEEWVRGPKMGSTLPPHQGTPATPLTGGTESVPSRGAVVRPTTASRPVAAESGEVASSTGAAGVTEAPTRAWPGLAALAVAGQRAAGAAETTDPAEATTRHWGEGAAEGGRRPTRGVPVIRARPAARVLNMRRSQRGGGRGGQRRAARVPPAT